MGKKRKVAKQQEEEEDPSYLVSSCGCCHWHDLLPSRFIKNCHPCHHGSYCQLPNNVYPAPGKEYFRKDTLSGLISGAIATNLRLNYAKEFPENYFSAVRVEIKGGL